MASGLIVYQISLICSSLISFSYSMPDPDFYEDDIRYRPYAPEIDTKIFSPDYDDDVIPKEWNPISLDNDFYINKPSTPNNRYNGNNENKRKNPIAYNYVQHKVTNDSNYHNNIPPKQRNPQEYGTVTHDTNLQHNSTPQNSVENHYEVYQPNNSSNNYDANLQSYQRNSGNKISNSSPFGENSSHSSIAHQSSNDGKSRFTNNYSKENVTTKSQILRNNNNYKSQFNYGYNDTIEQQNTSRYNLRSSQNERLQSNYGLGYDGNPTLRQRNTGENNYKIYRYTTERTSTFASKYAPSSTTKNLGKVTDHSTDDNNGKIPLKHVIMQ